MQRTPVHSDPLGLSVQRTFVVQLSDRTDVAGRRLSGRVEHVVSGRAASFSSTETLLEFFRRVLQQNRPTEQGGT